MSFKVPAIECNISARAKLLNQKFENFIILTHRKNCLSGNENQQKMYRLSKTKIIIAVLILAVLNFAAFYALKIGIGISDTLQHSEGKELAAGLEQKSTFIDFFSSIVITLDIAVVLLLLYLFIKFIIRNIKTSKNAQ